MLGYRVYRIYRIYLMDLPRIYLRRVYRIYFNGLLASGYLPKYSFKYSTSQFQKKEAFFQT